jgi:hypothetical protein
VFHHGSSRFGKDDKGKKRRDSQNAGYYYKAKSPAKEEKKDPPKKASMASLLKGLKAEAYNKLVGQDDEVSEDEDVKGFVERRLSMNITNMAGMNF